MRYLKASAAISLGAAALLITNGALAAGADIKHSGLAGSIGKYGPVGGTYAYVLGSNTCNVGDSSLAWINRGTPGLAMNAYRLHNGRFIQVGLGNAKTACCVANSTSPLCGGPTCSSSGFGLRPGCMDTYSAGFNAGQHRLAPRSFMEPQSGVISTAYPGTTGDAIFRRLQVSQADMDPVTWPGALFFAEGHYVCTEDAVANNDLNNASYGRVALSGSYDMTLQGNFNVGTPAVYAWRDHGGGPNIPDPSVTILPVDVPNEGRFIAGHKVIDNGDGTWRYEYAIANFNSDRAAKSFHVPLPAGAVVTNTYFNAPNYHSGEVYSNADWDVVIDSCGITWSTSMPFIPNAPPPALPTNDTANALRWGTLANFSFTVNAAPVSGTADLGLFKPATGCQPTDMSFTAQVPRADCDADIACNGTVDVDDLLSVIAGWGPCACSFSCENDIVSNGQVDVDDLLVVIKSWGDCQ